MSGIRGVMKEGWHPKSKDGGNESWRSDFKGIDQVAGFIGKGKSGSQSSAPRTERASRPLSSLKDPSSFAPPPRRSTAPNSGGFRSTPAETRPEGQRRSEQVHEEDAAAKPSPPPVPYRADTTGLSTSQFAKPPARRNELSADQPDPSSDAKPPPLKPKPALPPRLPPRGGSSNPAISSPSPPPDYEDRSGSHLNHSAINRLGNAGVSVGGLGIQPSARNGSTEQATTHSSSAQQSSPQNELQARFAKMTTSSQNPPVSTSTAKAAAAAAAPLAQGRNNHSQNQAESHQQAPHQTTSDLSYGDAKRAASSANTFRERHNDHIQAGKQKFNNIDQKYGIKRRISGFIEDQKSPAYPDPNSQHEHQQHPQPCPHQCQQLPQQQPSYNQSASSPYSTPTQNSSRLDLEALNKRKPPPPPPSRKPALEQAPGQAPSQPGSAPPLPLDTKPR